jgi:hypothetical protein
MLTFTLGIITMTLTVAMYIANNQMLSYEA